MENLWLPSRLTMSYVKWFTWKRLLIRPRPDRLTWSRFPSCDHDLPGKYPLLSPTAPTIKGPTTRPVTPPFIRWKVNWSKKRPGTLLWRNHMLLLCLLTRETCQRLQQPRNWVTFLPTRSMITSWRADLPASMCLAWEHWVRQVI
ncbi:Uncharacterised protein [Chlamydia trachomatis]|nr:Uncharacterised protein [Chlamydia trachomatis]